MSLFNGWKLRKASPDTERVHLNKILEEISTTIGAITGVVASVNSGTGVDVDNSDPINPVINLDATSIASLALADTAIQAADLGTAAYEDTTFFATAAQGALADSAVQPGDNVSVLVNDAGYSTTVGTVTSVDLANSTGLTASGGPITASGSLTYTLSANLQAWHGLATSAKQDTDTTLTALAGANWALNAFPIGSGADTVSQVAFAANTFPARASTGDLVAKTITDGSLSVLAGSGTSAQFLRADGTAANELINTAGTQTFGLDAYGGNGNFRGRRYNGTLGTPTNVLSGQLLFAISAAGYDGSIISNAVGRIAFHAEEDFTTTAWGSHIRFLTTDLGAVAQSEKMRLQSDGTLRPGLDNTYALGNASFRWSEVFAGIGSINTSDARLKTPVRPFTPAELKAASALASEVGVFQFLAAREKKGDGARQHCGMTVQRAIEVMKAHGLDPQVYGFICYDQWDATPEIRDEDGEVVQPAIDAGDRYSFRPDQLDRFITRGLHERLIQLEERLAKLEIT